IAQRDELIVATETALTELGQQRHQHEKTLLGQDLQRASLSEAETRLSKKREVICIERRTVEEELAELDARRTEAQASIERLEGEQRIADERFMAAQRRVLDARESIDALSRDVAEVRAGHAALVERASALEASANRLERASEELEDRVARQIAEHGRTRTGQESLIASVANSKEQLDHDVTALAVLRDDVRTADEQVLSLREQLEAEDMAVRAARADLEQERGDVGELDLARATAERDLGHLEETCRETLQLPLSDVAVEAKQLEADGLLSGHVPGAAEEQEEHDESADETPETGVSEDESGATPEELEAVVDSIPDRVQSAPSVDGMVTSLREKIDRLGPVNMMAIEEFDDLDERYDFLTGQRQDLVESISATGDAISRINKTTRERFREAFEAINGHFQETFSTLFGGGRAGLTLLDETDHL
ncbi:MAG: hypothetical protein VYE68_01690, partial [Acidobacteriota bacterium]|nr:hypothetical protein [Acidobacteriota bacterium]